MISDLTDQLGPDKGPKRKSESELEWAERHYLMEQAAWKRFQEAHGDDPGLMESTSWPASVADALATLELRRAGDDTTMVRTNVAKWLAEQARKDREAASPHTTPYGDQDEPWTPQSIWELAEKLGRKFEVGDVDEDLYQYAVKWLKAKPTPISFEYLKDLRAQLDDGKQLSYPQAKGVLNCVVADARRDTRGPAPRPGVVPTATSGAPGPQEGPQRAALSPGIYSLTEDGQTAIFKVQAAVHGSKHLYAKRLIATEGGETKGKFEFEKGAISRLTPEDRMSLEDAKKFGAIYGVCIVCGALLTDDNSIANGIGPVCASKL